MRVGRSGELGWPLSNFLSSSSAPWRSEDCEVLEETAPPDMFFFFLFCVLDLAVLELTL